MRPWLGKLFLIGFTTGHTVQSVRKVKLKRPLLVVWLTASLCAIVDVAVAQGFLNLNFEESYVVSSQPTPYGFRSGMANVPGWTAYYAWGASNYPGGTTLIYNNETLDAANASLEAADYFQPRLAGNYSVLLKGGTYSSQVYGTKGVSLGQVGQIPPQARILSYWSRANYFHLSFDGHPLMVTDLGPVSSNPGIYPGIRLFGADISGYAGQTGELLFHVGWQSMGGMIDNIAFSSIPEPGSPILLGLGIFCLAWRRSQWR